MEKIKVSEIFYSIEGEGKYSGVPTTFVRTGMCDLRCKWEDILCDTFYSSWSPEYKNLSIEQILEEVSKYNTNFINISGGNPFVEKNLVKLTEQLKKSKFHVRLETQATIYQEVFADFLSISPKLSNSIPYNTEYEKMHAKHRLNFDVLRKFIEQYDYQLKFVINRKEDIEEVKDVTRILGVKEDKVYLMPCGKNNKQIQYRRNMVAELCKENCFNYSDRLHIILYGDRRGV